MAGPACMSNDGREAVFVGTMLTNGDAYQLCDECLASWAIALVSTMTGVDPAPFLAAISDDEPIPYELVTPAGEEPPAEQPADSDPDAAQEAAAAGSDPQAAPKKRGRKTPENASGRMSPGSPDPGTGGARGTTAGVTQTNSAPPTV